MATSTPTTIRKFCDVTLSNARAGQWANFIFSLDDIFSGGKLVQMSPDSCKKIEGLDDIAASYTISNWLSAIASGALYAFRSLRLPRQRLLVCRLQGHLGEDGMQALADGAAVGVARLTEHDAPPLEPNGWAIDIQIASAPIDDQTRTLPSLPDYSFWAALEPFEEIGGDLYYFHQLPGGETLVVLADALGHGIQAASRLEPLLVLIKMAVNQHGSDVVGIVKAIGLGLCEYDKVPDAHTALMALALDPVSHRVRVVNAGMPLGVVRRRDGSVENLAEPGGPVGILMGTDYAVKAAELGLGDAVFACSDGILDARHAGEGIYGTERLKDILARTEGEAAKLGEAVLGDVKKFAKPGGLSDDIAAVCFVRKPLNDADKSQKG